MLKPDPPRRPRPSATVAYAVAILSVAAAVAIALLLDIFLQTSPYVSTFLCAIMFVAWFGGTGPGLLATALAALAFAFIFVAPLGSFEVSVNDLPRVLLFCVAALFVLSLSAAQRATADSLRQARDELKAENAERRRIEEYLDEAQRLSNTGSFSWRIASGDVFWSKEAYRVLEVDPGTRPTIDLVLQRTHADDRQALRREIDRVHRGEQDYDYEHRWLAPNGATKHLHVRARRVKFETGKEEIVGALVDVSETRMAQEALHTAQTALAHATRVATLGEMSASIAHEVNQPLAGIVTNGEAARRWLDRKVPDLGEVHSAIERMISDGKRASQVVERLRALARKAPAQTALLDINEVINETVALVQREIRNHRTALQLDLAPGLPAVLADRIELQQIVINLVVNGLQAMEPVTDRPRNLVIQSAVQADEVIVSVRDSGVGIEPADMDRLFKAFFTTKANGMGMGLSICRSIIEAHGGRVWASRNAEAGTTFRFALPQVARSVP
jgi:C4-dicarboxylate-specific signal transduction histidine kinase